MAAYFESHHEIKAVEDYEAAKEIKRIKANGR
jgi:hypothetical protein